MQIKILEQLKRPWLFIAVAIIVLYSFISPGLEFFSVYRTLVISPTELEPIFGIPFSYNPAWLAAIMAPFVMLPGRIGLILFIILTVFLLLYSTQVFGGNKLIVLLSAQLNWILWWSQIEALVVFGVVIGWLAMKKKSWLLMFLAISLATLKPQIGLIPIILLWWWMGKDRWKSLVAYIFLLILSMLIWGPWPLWLIDGVLNIASRPETYDSWNASIGTKALILYIPALLVPLEKQDRLMALTAVGLLSSPYLPYYSTILLLCMAIPGWLYPFAFLGYFPTVLGTKIAWNGITLLPLFTLIWVLFKPYRQKTMYLFKKGSYSEITNHQQKRI